MVTQKENSARWRDILIIPKEAPAQTSASGTCLPFMKNPLRPQLLEAFFAGGYLPGYDVSLKLGRNIQNAWMDSYQSTVH
jgi:hypothetical protein